MLSRRPVPQHNRGRVPAGAAPPGPTPPPAFAPDDLSGLLHWGSADSTTDGGNGTAISAVADLSGNGFDLVEQSAGMGPIRRDASVRRPRVADFPVGVAPGGARVVGISGANALIAAAAGTGKQLTIVEVVQSKGVFGASIGTRWGWGNTVTASQYKAMRWGSTTVNHVLWSRDTGSNLVLNSVAKRSPMPWVVTTRLDGVANTMRVRIDAVEESAIVYNDGTATFDWYGWGRWPNGASLADSGYHFVRHTLVYDRLLSDAEVAQLEEWGGSEWGNEWKSYHSGSAAFGNGSNEWFIVLVVGQSNACGQDPSCYAGDGTTDNVYALFQDGFMRELTAEPASHNVDSLFGIPDTGLGAGSSFCRRMGERLRANGETRNIMFVNVAISGSFASEWGTGTGLTANPPNLSHRAGQAKHWVDEALKAPNAELVGVIYQGEQNSTSAPLAADWPVSWAPFLDEFNTRYASAFVKTKRWFIVNLPATPSSAGANWADLRANITTFCSTTRSDCTEVQCPDGPWIDTPTRLHIDASCENALGILLADAVWAAT